MRSTFKSIPVVDANGDRFTVYEFGERRFLRPVRRLKLCTGELVEYVDQATFAIADTGERLRRAR